MTKRKFSINVIFSLFMSMFYVMIGGVIYCSNDYFSNLEDYQIVLLSLLFIFYGSYRASRIYFEIRRDSDE
ncbi:MAG: hypothetical protein AB9882_01760 [Ignavibacteriaceae bacterium]